MLKRRTGYRAENLNTTTKATMITYKFAKHTVEEMELIEWLCSKNLLTHINHARAEFSTPFQSVGKLRPLSERKVGLGKVRSSAVERWQSLSWVLVASEWTSKVDKVRDWQLVGLRVKEEKKKHSRHVQSRKNLSKRLQKSKKLHDLLLVFALLRFVCSC